jgi:hypothetical protein
VSDYGLDDRAIGVRSPDSSSNLCVQNGSEAHPASCTMGTGGPFPGGKARPGRDADHSPTPSAEVVNEKELYLLSLQAPPWRVVGLLYFFFFGLLHSGFPTKILYAFLISPMHPTLTGHIVILLQLAILETLKCSTSCHFISFWYKYFPYNAFLNIPSLPILPQN